MFRMIRGSGRERKAFNYRFSWYAIQFYLHLTTIRIDLIKLTT